MLEKTIQQSAENIAALAHAGKVLDAVRKTIETVIAAVKSGGKVMICGNGGSAADAQHFAGEFVCRFFKDRAPMAAIALTTDTSVITAIGNDYSYDEIFSRQVAGLGKKGDVLIGISTSGNSRNVLKAFQEARRAGIAAILLTGEKAGSIVPESDVVIAVPSSVTPRIQEMHLLIEHIICEEVEKAVFGGR